MRISRGSAQYKACCDKYYANYNDWNQGRTESQLTIDLDLLYAAVIDLVWMRDNQGGIEDNMADGGNTRALVILDSMSRLADKKQKKLLEAPGLLPPFSIILQAVDLMWYEGGLPGYELAEDALSQLKGIGLQVPGVVL